MTPIEVTWLPEHPAAGSMSMQRYCRLLESAARPEDPFRCSSIFPLGKGDSIRRGAPLRYLARRLLYPTKIRFQASGDIIHLLDHSWAEMLAFAPRHALKIVTVHDLIPLRFPGELTPAQVQRFRRRVGNLATADAIIAVSEYTKGEVQNLLGIDDDKIHVVYNGADITDRMPSLPAASELPPRMPGDTSFRVGSIGTILERKNLAILPTALARLQSMLKRKVVLVRVGLMLPPLLAAELRKALGDDGLIELGLVPDEALAAYYAGLDVLAIPSRYEGFGLPVLEGMAAGIPVVASSSSSLPEVGGENVLYFDPADPEELARQLAAVAEKRLPDDWTALAYERAKRFSWRRTLEGIYEVYHLAMAERRRVI